MRLLRRQVAKQTKIPFFALLFYTFYLLTFFFIKKETDWENGHQDNFIHYFNVLLIFPDGPRWA
jgi:hypothetical protein